MKRIAVFGVGYVGCVTAACMSRDGHEVVGVDIDRDKVAALNRGESPVSEPGLDQLIRRQVERGALRATVDLEQAVLETEIGIVVVGTPSNWDGTVATAAVEHVVKAIGGALRRSPHPYTVVVRSTLLPGTLEERLAPLLIESAGRGLDEDLKLCNNPEFLRESSAIRDFDEPPFVIVGTMDGRAAEDVLGLYRGSAAEMIVTDTRTAALVKYASNAFHALKVVFGNEIGSLARSFGANGQQVMDLVCRDNKLNISKAYLRPGFAFGGSCLPKDVRALARHAEKEAVQVNVLRAILPSNQEHLQRAISMVEASTCHRLGLAGLSFKAGTDDLRESPFVVLVETLLGRGYDIKIYDPGISLSRLTGRNLAYIERHLPHLAALLVETPAELVQHAELLIFGTDVADSVAVPMDFSGETLDLRRDLVAPRAPQTAVVPA